MTCWKPYARWEPETQAGRASITEKANVQRHFAPLSRVIMWIPHLTAPSRSANHKSSPREGDTDPNELVRMNLPDILLYNIDMPGRSRGKAFNAQFIHPANLWKSRSGRRWPGCANREEQSRGRRASAVIVIVMD